MNTTTTLISKRFQVALDDKSTFLGQGGVGSVYRGLDLVTHEPVAVKLLKPELVAHDPEMVKRFAIEAPQYRENARRG
jgi:serine/threonine protein kinase